MSVTYNKDQIAKLAPGQYACGPGWFIDVIRLKDGTLARSYKFRFPKMRDGSRPELKIAGCDEWSYTRASKQAQEWRDMIRAGKDPRSVQQAIGGKAFQAFVLENIAGWSEGLNPREAYQWHLMLKQMPSLHALPIATITTDDIGKALHPLFVKRPKSAARQRRRLEKVFDKAIRYDKIRTAENPARWADIKHAPAIATLHKKALKAKRHHASVSFKELAPVITALRYETMVSARVLLVAILTATRSQEARRMEWNEVDLKRALWTIPAAKMKTREEHVVPLSRQALELIQAQPRVGTYVFPSDHTFGTHEPITVGALQFACTKVAPGTVPHGMRATFRNWGAAGRVEEDWLLEVCLAHAVGSSTVQAYRDKDEVMDRRRAVMQAWADYAMPPTNVVRIRAA